MPLVVGPELPRKDAPEVELVSWGDWRAEKLGWTKFAASTSLNPRSGFPQRIYIRDQKMLFVEYLDFNKDRSHAQDWWLTHISVVSEAAQGAVAILTVQNQKDAKALLAALI